MSLGHSHVIRNEISSDLPRHDISEKGEQVRDLILIRLFPQLFEYQAQLRENQGRIF